LVGERVLFPSILLEEVDGLLDCSTRVLESELDVTVRIEEIQKGL
jgi:hypothetical protein